MKSGYFISIQMLLCFFSLNAQYISEVLEYVPAPGQLINAAPWGTPDGVHSIEGDINGSVSLGAFGGYVIFRFENPVENDPQNPFGVDFTIFGNPMPDWSEPGVVWVMKDENENGDPDDTWYELAGSDYWFSSTKRKYRVTYSNPGGDVARDVPWADQLGSSGVIRSNPAHTQPYYPLPDSFPEIDPDSLGLEGTFLQGLVFQFPSGVRSARRAFGYADNQLRGSTPCTTPDNPYTREVENSGGDAFDIGWAVDSAGNSMELDQIHFIKIQSGLLAEGAWLGELSSEVTGAVDVSPDPALTGETAMVVIRDLPPQLEPGEYQLEVFVFEHGLVQYDRSVVWSASVPWASVDKNQILRITEEGSLTLTAALWGRPEISSTVSTEVQLNLTEVQDMHDLSRPAVLYPNPASGYFRIRGLRNSSLVLMDVSGRQWLSIEQYQEGTDLDISAFPVGMYLVKMKEGHHTWWFKLIKQ